MPNPKVGTVTNDISKAVRELKAGKVEFRVEKEGIVHVPVGKVQMTVQQLKDNVTSLVEAIMKAKPSSAKGIYLQAATVSSTMGPGVKLDCADLIGLVATT
jgi:large subunit ribosomal protein L1